MPPAPPSYLEPYTRAVKRHGPEFRSLLWASRRTQEQRFEAMTSLVDPSGLTVLDLGCGRADLLEFLIERNMRPRRYFGIEGVDELADTADRRNFENACIIRTDFLKNPHRMNVRADVICCSGSLNTLEEDEFHQVLRDAYAATTGALVFNFLSTSLLAGMDYLRWRRPEDVMAFARELSDDVTLFDSYMDGDCTIAIGKDLAR